MIFIRQPGLQPSSMQRLLDESAHRPSDAQAMDEEPGCESPAANGFAMTGLFGIIPGADAPPIRLPANNRLDTALD
ncbi:hypothetical protein [Fontivita pretiosa]|uniref:hypothetical protein n=1 Tax=Fontivita pretiosa TaxID=2989684 RepID=UPI003D1875E9